jgi:hypothetical protein
MSIGAQVKTDSPMSRYGKALLGVAIIAGGVWFFFLRGEHLDLAKAPAPAPAAETALIEGVMEGRAKYSAADNSFTASDVARGAHAKILGLLPERIDGWIGVLHHSVAIDGSGYVEIVIADDVIVENWTAISHDSPVYRALADLKVGQWVRFSASPVKVKETTIDRWLAGQPDILAHFSNIEALQP